MERNLVLARSSVLLALAPSLHGNAEFYSYRLVDGRPETPSFYNTTGNTFVPSESDAYVAVEKSLQPEWVPYWKLYEGLATMACPILSR